MAEPKTRKEINSNYYQTHKEKSSKRSSTYYQEHKEELKVQRKAKRWQKQEQRIREELDRVNKYYGAEALRVLMSLKDYTENNRSGKERWLNFIWTFNDLQKYGFHDIVQVMKLNEEGEKLIRNYWRTAKEELKTKWEWNNLDYDRQKQLIKYWGRKKVQEEENLEQKLNQLAEKGNSYEKEIELAKFHEERGKKGCQCWHCEQNNQIRKEVENEWGKMEVEEERELASEKIECDNCGRKVSYRQWDDETDMCKKCSKEFED